jgi:isopentenyl phosphate kinase
MIFLKLGGSLITDKAVPQSPRLDVLQRLAAEIHLAWKADPDMRLLIGHGSGSFGHFVAARHGTHLGAHTPADWLGFAEVWQVANRLNRIVLDALRDAGLPAISFPPSASAIAQGGDLTSLSSEPIGEALAHRLVPLVAGDVGFDRSQGSTILSTERVFSYLAGPLQPSMLLLAGVEPGVVRGYPEGKEILLEVGPSELRSGAIGASLQVDVTGGMADKVAHALSMARAVPWLTVRIFSGLVPGEVARALRGEAVGTLVHPED